MLGDIVHPATQTTVTDAMMSCPGDVHLVTAVRVTGSEMPGAAVRVRRCSSHWDPDLGHRRPE